MKNQHRWQMFTSLVFCIPSGFVLGYAIAVRSEPMPSFGPQTQPDCSKIVCTVDGAQKAEWPKIKQTINPQATITEVCYPTSCFSSWVPHETDSTAVGHEPQVFQIPKEDRKK